MAREARRATLKDVAEQAGVSMSTVSRVVNGEASVSDDIREIVHRVLSELNYEKSAGNVGNKKLARTVGVVVPDISNPFFGMLTKGIEKTARLFKQNLILCDSENDPKIEQELTTNLIDAGIAGLILVPVGGEDGSLIRRLIERGFPTVLLDRVPKNLEKVSSVVSNNFEGAYQAARYLLSLGHREILYLAGPHEATTETERREGFARALEEQGLSLDKQIRVEGSYDWERAQERVTGLIEDGIRFSAVFAANDMMALGAMQAFQVHEMRVPEHVSVVGYDNIPFSQLVSLTTVAQHPNEMAARAGRLLVDIIEKRVATPHSVVLVPSLIIRGSCRPL